MNKMIGRKFVFYSMTVISILLILLIGTINVAFLINTNNMAWNSLKVISEFGQQPGSEPGANPDRPENPGMKPGQEPPRQMVRNAYDTYMASNFFVVSYDADEKISGVDVSRTSLFTEAEAATMADEAIESGKTEGRMDKCLFAVKSNDETGESSVIFLDTSANLRTVLSVLVLSLLVGAACWLLMLLVSILLSKKATKPIVENIERQKRFVTDAGHEYKTPLAIIQSNADAMELHTGENKWLTNIRTQVERLTGLTQDMLLLAKMDEGRSKSRDKQIDFSERVEKQLEAFGQVIREKEIKLTYEVEENALVKGDCGEIDKLMGILIDNSIKYGRQGGYIDVQVKKNVKGTMFSVENDCDELPEVPPEKLFERFYRSDKARSQESGGSGVGLSIAQSIVDAYGGRIKAEYLGENVIRFTVEI